MLILTRRIDESIIRTLPDGSKIKFMITELTETQVKVGIEAPGDVNVVRDELL